MLICAYLFVAVESIVICPFASFLAEKAEQDITGKVRQQPEIPAGKYPAWIAGIAWHSLKRTARSYCFYLPCALLCLIIFLIPAVGQLARASQNHINRRVMQPFVDEYTPHNRQSPRRGYALAYS